MAVIAGVIGVVGVLASVVAVWAHQVIFDSRVMASAVESAMLEPEVTEAVATYLTDQVFDSVPVAELIEERLPDQLQRFAPVLAGGVRSTVHDGLLRILDDDTSRQVIVAATERSHRALMHLIEGGGLVDGVTVQGGDVSLNLLPLLGRGFELLQGVGLLSGVELPELRADGAPADQVAALEDATGLTLPDDFGQLVVYRSERLSQAEGLLARAQQALVASKRATALILGLTVVSLLASVALAVRRRRAALVVTLATVAALAIARAAIRQVVSRAPALVLAPGARAAIRAMVTSLASGLLAAVSLGLLLGLLLALAAFLTGPSPRAQALRGRATTSGSSVRAVVGANRDIAALVGFGLAVLVVSLTGFGAASLLLAALFAAFGAWALWGPQALDADSGGSEP